MKIQALPAGLQNMQEPVILVPWHFYFARYFLATFMRFLAKCRDLRASFRKKYGHLCNFLAKCRDLRTFFLVPPKQSKLFSVPPLSFYQPDHKVTKSFYTMKRNAILYIEYCKIAYDAFHTKTEQYWAQKGLFLAIGARKRIAEQPKRHLLENRRYTELPRDVGKL